jgi:hypothetical protein
MPAPSLSVRTAPYPPLDGRGIHRLDSSAPLRLVRPVALVLLVAAGLTLEHRAGTHTSLPQPSAAASPLRHEGLLALPSASRGPVSATLGGADPAYRVATVATGFTAAGPAQNLTMAFTRSGVTVRSAGANAGLALQAIGYGSALAPVAFVAPHAKANRVTYTHRGITEWYANGPLGLEQGFTINEAPRTGGHGPLTLAVGLSGRVILSGQSVLFEGHGKPALAYDGLRAKDASGRTLSSHMQLDGHRLLLRVDAAGARYPLTVDPLIQQGEKLTGSGEAGNAEAGWSVALSADGNTALVGGPNDEGQQGAGWVFTRSGSTWTQQGPKLTAHEASAKAAFGVSVALSADGNTAMIGAPLDKFNNVQQQLGSVRVFTRSGSNWTEVQELEAGVRGANDGFGTSVAISTDASTAAVGAPADEAHKGAVWIFKKSAGKWSLDAGLDSCEERTGEVCTKRVEEPLEGELGASVALSSDGKTVAIGAPAHGGAVWIYQENPEAITPIKYFQQGEKKTPANGSGFGSAVALSSDGNTALIGGASPGGGLGSAVVLTRSGSTWSEQAELTGTGEHPGDEFGRSLALSADGNTALIGAPEEEDSVEHKEGVGSVREFTRTGTTWSQLGEKFTGTGAQNHEFIEGAEFGTSVALSSDGSTAMIGGPFDHGGIGAAWVYSTATGPPKEEPKPPPPPVEEPNGKGKVISAAQIAAALSAGILPSGTAAKIAALLKHGGLSSKFSALEAGLATISWYQVPPGAKLAKKAKPKPVLVASGRLSFKAAGSGLVKLKLTSAGKRLLKHAKRLKLTARGTFTPNGGTAVTATKPFVLKR